MRATSTAIDPESAKKTRVSPGGAMAESRAASVRAGSCARPPNITCGIAASCRSTASRMYGWLYPWQTLHHDAMPSMSSRPSARTIRHPCVRTTGNGGGATFIWQYGSQT